MLSNATVLILTGTKQNYKPRRNLKIKKEMCAKVADACAWSRLLLRFQC